MIPIIQKSQTDNSQQNSDKPPADKPFEKSLGNITYPDKPPTDNPKPGNQSDNPKRESNE